MGKKCNGLRFKGGKLWWVRLCAIRSIRLCLFELLDLEDSGAPFVFKVYLQTIMG